MDLESLKNEFQNMDFDHAFGQSVMNYLSSKTDDGVVFAPYIPFLGRCFEKYRILVYCTAQNMSFNDKMRDCYSSHLPKLSQRLYHSMDFERRYREDSFNVSDVAIAPFQQFVIPGLIALYIRATSPTHENVSPEQILDYCGVSNFYKFSLNCGDKDMNPDDGMEAIPESERYEYWAINDSLVKRELEAIRPKVVLCFGGYKMRMLASFSRQFGYKLITINDPSWILRGGSKKLNPGQDWNNEYEELDSSVRDFMNDYSGFLTGSYSGEKMIPRVKAYWAHYYNEFFMENSFR